MSGIEMIETIKASGAENGFLNAGPDIMPNSIMPRWPFKIHPVFRRHPRTLQQIANITILMAGFT